MKNSRQFCKPEMQLRVCITLENSLKTLSVNVRLIVSTEKVVYCCLKSFLKTREFKTSL